MLTADKILFRNGQWVKFDFDAEDLLLVMVTPGNKVKLVKPQDASELAALKDRVQTAADGRMVGIFMQAANSTTLDRVEKHDAAGKVIGVENESRQVFLPATVAPQRRVLGAHGEQNFSLAWNGQAVTLLLKADTLKHVEPLLLREDIPAHRNQTCAEQWNPRR